MSYKLSDIVYETKTHFVLAGNGFEVYENGPVHAVKRASFGSRSNLGPEWLAKAKSYIDSRITAMDALNARSLSYAYAAGAILNDSLDQVLLEVGLCPDAEVVESPKVVR